MPDKGVTDSGSGRDEARRLFEELVASGGGHAAFSATCSRFPEHADELETLWHGHTATQPDRVDDLLARLDKHRPASSPLHMAGRVGRGGMGLVVKLWDEDLRRSIAGKVIRRDGRRPGPDGRQRLARFLEEAQITSQLEHPGIVPVYGLGRDARGRVFFTMRLVRDAHDLNAIFSMVARGTPGWTLARALGVILKVCETMAFAHSKGAVHRDLKPSNILVGRFGETYVADWGLARIAGRPGARDIRLRTTSPKDLSEIVTDRERKRAASSDDLVTVDGDVIGTPSYMPPEQARGELNRIGSRSDVYSVGAMLYHLLAGLAPYSHSTGPTPARLVLARVVAGPPESLRALSSKVPPDLIAITERAMAREPEDRYSGALELARDIEAFLTDRPIQETSVLRAMRLAVRRHRGIARTASAALILAAAILTWGLGATAAEAAKTRVLTDASLARDLLRQERDGELWPASPEHIDRLQRFAQEANRLIERAANVVGSSDSAVASESEDLQRNADKLRALLPAVGQGIDLAQTIAHLHANQDPEAWPLPPQLGLVPLGEDPESGLSEFWYVPSGARPARLPDGGYRIERDTGIVLVLLPGGTFVMGDKQGESYEAPHEVTIAPFFAAKFELTQGQFERVMGFNRSQYHPGHPTKPVTWRHPVERISWNEAAECARRLGMSLPTEAQWEWCARAGSPERSWVGADVAGFASKENLCDISTGLLPCAPWDDGWPVHAPVGSLAPNAFGLFDVAGNVIEWCRDPFLQDLDSDAHRPGDGAHDGDPRERVARGASWQLPPLYAYAAFKSWDAPDALNQTRGARLIRPIDP